MNVDMTEWRKKNVLRLPQTLWDKGSKMTM